MSISWQPIETAPAYDCDQALVASKCRDGTWRYEATFYPAERGKNPNVKYWAQITPPMKEGE